MVKKEERCVTLLALFVFVFLSPPESLSPPLCSRVVTLKSFHTRVGSPTAAVIQPFFCLLIIRVLV